MILWNVAVMKLQASIFDTKTIAQTSKRTASILCKTAYAGVVTLHCLIVSMSPLSACKMQRLSEQSSSPEKDNWRQSIGAKYLKCVFHNFACGNDLQGRYVLSYL